MASDTIVAQANGKVKYAKFSMNMADEGRAAAYYYAVSISLLEGLWRRLFREPSK